MRTYAQYKAWLDGICRSPVDERHQEDQNLVDLVKPYVAALVKSLEKGDVKKAKNSYKAIGNLLK
jgi:hypothetical protein